MADVAVHLRVLAAKAGAIEAFVAEQVEVLGLSLGRAFKDEIPTRSGTARASIRMEPPALVAGLWRLRFRGKFWIRFLRSGARPHVIAPRHGSASGAPELRMTVGGGFVFAGRVQHPGMRKTHFTDRALAKAIPGAVARFRAGLAEVVAQEIRSAL